jgi:hypothetical protein
MTATTSGYDKDIVHVQYSRSPLKLGVTQVPALPGRIPDEAALRRRVNASVAERQPINWRFTIRDARSKLNRLYPSTAA